MTDESDNSEKPTIDRTCETCGVIFPQKVGNKTAKHCHDCRVPTGKNPRDMTKIREREKARKKTKADSKAAMERSLSAHQVSELAAALSVFTDPEDAAKYIGLDCDVDELSTMVEEAHRIHGDTIDGDLSALSRKLIMGINLIVGSLIRQRDQISPRDAPHVGRALSQIYETIGGTTQTRFASIQLQVIGADGRPFTLGGPDSEEESEEAFAKPVKKPSLN